jgi:lysine-ketoglutarate reductase/saccharopine dehydrogenase-like protein (TIGR00300 family)
MVTEEIQLEGHIIDSLILSKVLDEILAFGGDFHIRDVAIGQDRHDRSFARVEVVTDDQDQMAGLLNQLARHGAIVRKLGDAHLVSASRDGVFPEGFYSTTNQKTLIRRQEQWHEVRLQEMDCGIRFDEAAGTFSCVPLCHVKAGDPIVVGHRGVKVIPLEREREASHFAFMSSNVSTEKPKNVMIHSIATKMQAARDAGKPTILVGGPAIVHTGSVGHIVRLIEAGYIQVLFAGNALATHDIEQALYGTSLGVHMERAIPTDTGHEHHLRAINTIRHHGSIRAAIEAGTLTSGIMHACLKHNVDVVLAGSIRDDGPLPEVITDALVAQDKMRQYVQDAGFCLMIATTLHSVATGNLLPAWVPVACVDISPSVITKLADRGSFQTVGLVTDVEPFLRELLHVLKLEPVAAA